jgi:hypothetical protein
MSDLMQMMITQQRAILAATSTAQVAAEGVARAIQLLMERSSSSNVDANMATSAIAVVAAEAINVTKTEKTLAVPGEQTAAKQKLNPEVSAIIDKAAETYEKEVRRHLKATRRLDKLKDDIEVLSRANLQYPAGIRAFASTVSNLELDEVMNETRDADAVVEITIPRGTMRREAMKIFHHHAQREIKKIEAQAAESAVSKSKELSKKTEFS